MAEQHQLMKSYLPLTLEQRLDELTYMNGYLREELAYYESLRVAASTLYLETVDRHEKLSNALKEKSRMEAEAESRLLDYWGINDNDVNWKIQTF